MIDELKDKLSHEERKVLSAIQAKASKKFGDKIIKEDKRDEIRFVFDKVLENSMPEWRKRFYSAMRDEIATPKMVEDQEVIKQMDEYIEEEIAKAIKNGKLPEKK